MKQKLNLDNTPRQLRKPIWINDGSACGYWANDYSTPSAVCMDAPDCIPTGSTKWRIGYVENGIEHGEASETLRHREGWF